MKEIFEKIRESFNNGDESNKKTILFFGFYIIFFIVLFLVIIFGGKRDYLLQEYEKGITQEDPEGVLSRNYLYDYKVTIDGVIHDYYGKRYEDQESFKYNNHDYYRENDDFYVLNGSWVKCENPYLSYNFLYLENLAKILQQASLMESKVLDDGSHEYHYLVSSNTLMQILHQENTDYDEVPDSLEMYTNEKNYVTKIVYHLDHYCVHKATCKSSLTIEMNFELFGEVQKIDNPLT